MVKAVVRPLTRGLTSPLVRGGASYWGGVLVCSKVLACTEVVYCG